MNLPLVETKSGRFPSLSKKCASGHLLHGMTVLEASCIGGHYSIAPRQAGLNAMERIGVLDRLTIRHQAVVKIFLTPIACGKSFDFSEICVESKHGRKNDIRP
jgi:hypothetical protein